MIPILNFHLNIILLLHTTTKEKTFYLVLYRECLIHHSRVNSISSIYLINFDRTYIQTQDLRHYSTYERRILSWNMRPMETIKQN